MITNRNEFHPKITFEKRPITHQNISHQLTHLAFTIFPRTSQRLSSRQMAVSGRLNKEQNYIWQSLMIALQKRASEGDMSLRFRRLSAAIFIWQLGWKVMVLPGFFPWIFLCRMHSAQKSTLTNKKRTSRTAVPRTNRRRDIWAAAKNEKIKK